MHEPTLEGASRQPALGTEVYELFDAKRMRIVRRAGSGMFDRLMTANEALEANRHLAESLCPHLYWQRAGAVRRYVIKK